MKKYKLAILLLIVITLLVIKAFYLFNLKLTKEEIDKLIEIKEGLIISDLLVINTEEQEKYLEYKNIKFKDISNDYKCEEKDNKFTCQKDDNTKVSIEVTKSYLELFAEENKNIIKKLNIKNDLELFSKIKESSNNTSILKTISTNKNEYQLNKFALKNKLKLHSIDLIEGDYSGLLLHDTANSRKLYIYYDNKTYLFVFNNLKEFDNENLSNFMNSIKIK